MTKAQASEAIQRAMKERSLTFAELAGRSKRPRVWLAAAILGQHPFSREEAEELVAILDPPCGGGISAHSDPYPRRVGRRGPGRPTIYRLYEVIQVYGPALKALIHEEFGDGIMSAINFRADVERVPDPAFLDLQAPEPAGAPPHS